MTLLHRLTSIVRWIARRERAEQDLNDELQAFIDMAADDDITLLEHMLELYRAIPNSELAIVPGTSHFLLQEKPALCNAILIDFLSNDPVSTVAPIRRAAHLAGGRVA